MERILEQCNPLCLSCECGDSSISAQSQKERPGQGCPLPLTSAVGAVARPENRSQRNTARLRRGRTTHRLFYRSNFLTKECCRDTCSVSVRSEICVVQLTLRRGVLSGRH